MATTTVIESGAAKQKSKIDLRVYLAFAAIYVLWGSTYLAIRIAVQEVPAALCRGDAILLCRRLCFTR